MQKNATPMLPRKTRWDIPVLQYVIRKGMDAMDRRFASYIDDRPVTAERIDAAIAVSEALASNRGAHERGEPGLYAAIIGASAILRKASEEALLSDVQIDRLAQFCDRSYENIELALDVWTKQARERFPWWREGWRHMRDIHPAELTPYYEGLVAGEMLFGEGTPPASAPAPAVPVAAAASHPSPEDEVDRADDLRGMIDIHRNTDEVADKRLTEASRRILRTVYGTYVQLLDVFSPRAEYVLRDTDLAEETGRDAADLDEQRQAGAIPLPMSPDFDGNHCYNLLQAAAIKHGFGPALCETEMTKEWYNFLYQCELLGIDPARGLGLDG